LKAGIKLWAYFLKKLHFCGETFYAPNKSTSGSQLSVANATGAVNPNPMELSTLTSIGPVDGRYRNKTAPLSAYFSEYGLIAYRVRVEILYFLALHDLALPPLQTLPPESRESLLSIANDFGPDDALRIKAIEQVTNHDVKAVEYFIKEKMEDLGLGASQEFVHFGLTSQDVNNTAIPLSMKEAVAGVVSPLLAQVLQKLRDLSALWAERPMLAFTHGQPASPTRLGKEIAVFAYRLQKQWDHLQTLPYPAKFGGATGNFNAHYVAFPAIDWEAFADQFVEEKLGLSRSAFTTQIENYDFLAAHFDAYKRIGNVLTDLCRDCWQYISLGYFKQAIKPGEVGSSAMPHKVNPIDFENAEGNLGIANAIFEHLAAKLPVSRLQRDLTDSTVLRNLGVPFAHLVIAMESLLKGLNKLELNAVRLDEDLENNWAVVAEAIQTILRREGYPQPYEALKALTRNHQVVTRKTMADFIQGLAVNDAVKEELLSITPYNYTGLFNLGKLG
jgi:adenylosuccinate lyase